jgi:hypothetical protein
MRFFPFFKLSLVKVWLDSCDFPFDVLAPSSQMPRQSKLPENPLKWEVFVP